MKNQTQEARKKCKGAFQKILMIAEDPSLKGIQMETIWKLLESCITPILTYGCELWTPNKEEQQNINRIMDNIVKRILMVLTSTPREALYIETAIKDPESIMKQKRIGMRCRLGTTSNTTIAETMDIEEEWTWKNQTDQLIQKLGITSLNNLMTDKKQAQKKTINEAIEKDLQEKDDLSQNNKIKNQPPHER